MFYLNSLWLHKYRGLFWYLYLLWFLSNLRLLPSLILQWRISNWSQRSGTRSTRRLSREPDTHAGWSAETRPDVAGRRCTGRSVQATSTLPCNNDDLRRDHEHTGSRNRNRQLRTAREPHYVRRGRAVHPDSLSPPCCCGPAENVASGPYLFSGLGRSFPACFRGDCAGTSHSCNAPRAARSMRVRSPAQTARRIHRTHRPDLPGAARSARGGYRAAVTRGSSLLRWAWVTHAGRLTFARCVRTAERKPRRLPRWNEHVAAETSCLQHQPTDATAARRSEPCRNRRAGADAGESLLLLRSGLSPWAFRAFGIQHSRRGSDAALDRNRSGYPPPDGESGTADPPPYPQPSTN